MSLILKSIWDVFSRARTARIRSAAVAAPPLPSPPSKTTRPGEIFPVYRQSYVEVSAHPEGLFSFWVSDSSRAALKDDMGLSLKDIEPLAMKVFEKCLELGFWHGKPVHFLMDVHEIDRDPEWTACKITPPRMIAPGKLAERAITVFLPNLRRETNDVRQAVSDAAAKCGRFQSEEAKRAYFAATLDRSFKTKHMAIMTHEMVHIFATDEYYPIMDVLGLQKLELLTDAINTVAFYPSYKSADDWIKGGFSEGSGYIMNQLRAEQPNLLKPKLAFELLNQRARRIIKESQALLKPEVSAEVEAK